MHKLQLTGSRLRGKQLRWRNEGLRVEIRATPSAHRELLASDATDHCFIPMEGVSGSRQLFPKELHRAAFLHQP